MIRPARRTLAEVPLADLSFNNGIFQGRQFASVHSTANNDPHHGAAGVDVDFEIRRPPPLLRAMVHQFYWGMSKISKVSVISRFASSR